MPSKNGSVDPEQNFKMEWEVDSFSKKYLKEITDAAKDSTKIILATDPDREGEAIAWHVKEYLNEKKLIKDKHVERVVFNEITKKAVIHGIENPRQIEPLLVDAYMARRALDYLVGFNISPILWTKLPGSKDSIPCSRSVINFNATDWTLPADLEPGSLVHKIGEILNPTK